MPNDSTPNLCDRWLRMWNGDVALAPEIVTPDCVVHQAPFRSGPPLEFRGSEGIARMVEMGRQPFVDLTFTLAVGPIVDGDFLAARWVAEGRYRGGLPGATAPAGTPVTYGGADIFRLQDGQIAEYWVSADALHLMVQLGAITFA